MVIVFTPPATSALSTNISTSPKSSIQVGQCRKVVNFVASANMASGIEGSNVMTIDCLRTGERLVGFTEIASYYVSPTVIC